MIIVSRPLFQYSLAGRISQNWKHVTSKPIPSLVYEKVISKIFHALKLLVCVRVGLSAPYQRKQISAPDLAIYWDNTNEGGCVVNYFVSDLPYLQEYSTR